MIKNFEEIHQKLSNENPCNMGVVVAQDSHTLEAVAHAAKEGVMRPILYGHAERIAELWTGVAPELPLPQVRPCDTEEACISAALNDVREGKLGCIMKGKVETGTLMKAVVNREHGIRNSDALSIVAMMESPYYHKLFAVTDVGLMTYPTLAQKKELIKNAVGVFHALGTDCPKVAVLAAVEKVSPNMPETGEAAELKRMNESGELTGCLVEGPISYDLCMDPEAAAIKGYASPVAGDPDILVVPNIVAGNLLAKCLTCTGGAKTFGVVCGAKVPIVITSRSAPAEDKYRSIVLSAVLGQN